MISNIYDLLRQMHYSMLAIPFITSSTVVQSHIQSLCDIVSILHLTAVYPLLWSAIIAPQPHYHRSSVPLKSWNISTSYTTNIFSIWCKPVSSRSTTTGRTVSMTEQSIVVSGANITDHHIGMIRNEVTIQTEIYT